MRESSIRGPRRETPPPQARAFPIDASDEICDWERCPSASNGFVDRSLSPEPKRGLPRQAGGEEERNASSSPSPPKAQPTTRNRDSAAAIVGRDGNTCGGSNTTSSPGNLRPRNSETRVVGREDIPQTRKEAAVARDRNAATRGVLKGSSPPQKDRWFALEVIIPRLDNPLSGDHFSAADRIPKSPPRRDGCRKRTVSPGASSESRDAAGVERSGFREDRISETRPWTITEKRKANESGDGDGGGVQDDGCAVISRAQNTQSDPGGAEESSGYTQKQGVNSDEKSPYLRGGRAASTKEQGVGSSQRPLDHDDEESTAGSGEENYVDPLPRHPGIDGISGDGRFVVRSPRSTETHVGDTSSGRNWPTAAREMPVATGVRVVAPSAGLSATHRARPSIDRRDISKSESMVTLQVDSSGAVTYMLTPDAPRRGKWSRLEEEYAKR